MSCLDIHYSVSFRAKKAVKDEKKDQTAPIVLNNIADTSSDSDSEPEGEHSCYVLSANNTIYKGIMTACDFVLITLLLAIVHSLVC